MVLLDLLANVFHSDIVVRVIAQQEGAMVVLYCWAEGVVFLDNLFRSVAKVGVAPQPGNV